MAMPSREQPLGQVRSASRSVAIEPDQQEVRRAGVDVQARQLRQALGQPLAAARSTSATVRRA